MSKIKTILDNQSNALMLDALNKICDESLSLDIATGLFEIGSLLEMDGHWQVPQIIRIVMGDETTKRTKRALLKGIVDSSNTSIEDQKEQDDSLKGLDAVTEALRSGKIEARMYTKAKFHAKAYLAKMDTTQLVNFGIVGSSNLTAPGLKENLELNLVTTMESQLQALWKWYEKVWNDSVPINDELLNVIKPHITLYRPFLVYVKALYEYFRGREPLQKEWEENGSKVYPILSQYQKDGYHRALQIADRWNGVFICDGVGLGKTFIGLMLIEYFQYLGKRILLIVPKSARKSVWERFIKKYVGTPRVFGRLLDIRNHTDFGREGTVSKEEYEELIRFTDVIIVDEAHHFRHRYRNRGKMLYELADEKKLFFLTATPINNSVLDLYFLTTYITREDQKKFRSIGIPHHRKHFRELEKKFETGDIQGETQEKDLTRTDKLIREILIQRSRKYIKESEGDDPKAPLFPRRHKPEVIDYSLSKIYGRLLKKIEGSMPKKDKLRKGKETIAPLLNLALYTPEAYRIDEKKRDPSAYQDQAKVAGLIRTLLLKRLESSYKAFEGSLEDLLKKMLKFVTYFDFDKAENWKTKNKDIWDTILEHHSERFPEADIEEEFGEDFGLEDPLEKYEDISHKDIRVDFMVRFTLMDMDTIVDFLSDIYTKLSPDKDDKVIQLATALRTREKLRGRKIVIFTEFRDTARYIARQLAEVYQIPRVEQLDSTRGDKLRERMIKRFAPYYNCEDEELNHYLEDPIDLLVSTDVLSEGLNLQDSNIIINYDLHWNPVRLMQRIGRVDRRIDPDKPVCHRDVFVFNFLPLDELDDILGLMEKLDGKFRRINKTLGIEGSYLRPDDPESTLKEFNEKYEGKPSVEEVMQLEFSRLQKKYPNLFENIENLPRRLFSGKLSTDEHKGLFAAYRFPSQSSGGRQQLEIQASIPGPLRWYFRNRETGEITEETRIIFRLIECTSDTNRIVTSSWEQLSEERTAIETEKVLAELRSMQTIVGEKANLVCWMEIG